MPYLGRGKGGKPMRFLFPPLLGRRKEYIIFSQKQQRGSVSCVYFIQNEREGEIKFISKPMEGRQSQPLGGGRRTWGTTILERGNKCWNIKRKEQREVEEKKTLSFFVKGEEKE